MGSTKKKVMILSNGTFIEYRFRQALIKELLGIADVVVFAHKDRNWQELEALGSQVIDMDIETRGTNPFQELKTFFSMKRVIRDLSPDLIYSFTIKPNIYGGLIAHCLNIPTCASITGIGSSLQSDSLLARLNLKLYRRALRKSRVVFFQNEENRKFFLDKKLVDPERTEMTRGSGVDTQLYTYQPYPQDGPDRFVFIGRVMREKGIGEFLEAARLVHAQHPEVQFDILGEICEDRWMSVIDEMTGYGVQYFGHVDNVTDYISGSRCVVLPSYHEGMSNTLLEAAAMGRPLIASDIPGCREVIDDGQTGFLCQVQSGPDLAEKMLRFLTLSTAEKTEMGKRGRTKICREFSKEKVVAKYMRQAVQILEL